MTILIIATLLSAEKITVQIHNPSLKTYEELQTNHASTLTCPCLVNTMPYQRFINVKTAIHQICTSDFVGDQWINSLYMSDASRYSALDFRSTAHAQVDYC